MAKFNFDEKLQAMIRKGSELVNDTQELIEYAFNKASIDGDFDYSRRILQGLWTSKRYTTAKVVRDYFSAHGPFAISFTQEDSKFAVKKDKSENAVAFTELDVTYANWQKEKVVKELTLVSAIKSIDGLVSKIENSGMSGADKQAAFAHIADTGRNHIAGVVPEVAEAAAA